MSTVEPIRNIPDIRRIENTLSKNKRDLLLFTIGINCGLRVSDILALNVGDVKGKNFIKLTEKKTGKAKKIPINDKLLPMVAEYTRGKSCDNPLFMTKFKNRLNRVTAYNIIKQACEESGLHDTFGTHTMRKTFGYHHYQKFKDVAMLQKIFNHSSPQVTLRYIGIEQDQINQSYTNFML